MKKMTKGAIVTGLGVALLLGGGGTLAVWNATDDVEAGTIASGQLAMKADKGVWTVAGTDTIIPSIEEYKLAPGDSVTYTQNVDVTLDGENLEAILTVTGLPQNQGFTTNEFSFTDTTLVDEEGNDLLVNDNVLASKTLNEHSPETLTASTTFNFSEDATGSMNATYGLNNIQYQLTQLTD